MSTLDEYNRTALHYLCIDVPREDRAEAIKKLLASGLDVNALDSNGWSPLHFAAQASDVEVTQSLISAGAKIGIRDTNGNNELWVATMNAHSQFDVVKILLQSGANPSEKNDHDVSPMDIRPELFINAT
jgi:ankyrin repeat protein